MASNNAGHMMASICFAGTLDRAAAAMQPAKTIKFNSGTKKTDRATAGISIPKNLQLGFIDLNYFTTVYHIDIVCIVARQFFIVRGKNQSDAAILYTLIKIVHCRCQ